MSSGSWAPRAVRETTPLGSAQGGGSLSAPLSSAGSGTSAAALRASTATTSAVVAPARIAAAMPCWTAAAGMRRRNSRTSISARVPAASPCADRAAAQNASCTSVNEPFSRAVTRAVEPAMAPGLASRISR
ncbi:hypothetical protein ACTPOK_01520 [Streptomyces inhibens]|uniref:hypothetical protein n=1 Tax=Streptomyces inhibens TaxID=2293571 RepID=UPI00402AF315